MGSQAKQNLAIMSILECFTCHSHSEVKTLLEATPAIKLE